MLKQIQNSDQTNHIISFDNYLFTAKLEGQNRLEFFSDLIGRTRVLVNIIT